MLESEEHSRPQAFKLSLSNMIAFGIVAFVAIAFFVLFSEKTAHNAGYLSGALFGFILIPVLFAWPVWRFSGRNETAGSLTFNIVLALMVLGNLTQFNKEVRRQKSMRDLEAQREDFKRSAVETEDPAEFDAAADAFTDSVKEEFTRMAEGSTGDEQRFFDIMSDFVRDSQIMAQNWRDAYNAVLDPRVLDVSLLTTDEEFSYQIGVLRNYVEQSQIYAESAADTLPRLKERLSVLGEGNEMAVGALEGAREKHLAQKPIFDPLMAAHIEYGNNMILLLELLQENQDGWEFTDDELSIVDEQLLDQYNNVIEGIMQNEETINTLSEKLIESM